MVEDRVPPCRECGSQAFHIWEDRPAECVACFDRKEGDEVDSILAADAFTADEALAVLDGEK